MFASRRWSARTWGRARPWSSLPTSRVRQALLSHPPLPSPETRMSSECHDGVLSWRGCVLSVSISDYICLLAGPFIVSCLCPRASFHVRSHIHSPNIYRHLLCARPRAGGWGVGFRMKQMQPSPAGSFQDGSEEDNSTGRHQFGEGSGQEWPASPEVCAGFLEEVAPQLEEGSQLEGVA